jgi:hypothetical protein
MRMLDDPAFFAPFAPHFHPVIGRPSTPIECYLRLIHWACLTPGSPHPRQMMTAGPQTRRLIG